MIFLPAKYPSVDFLYNILGLGFYGEENQGTEILSENYFEVEENEEEDFTEEEQDLINNNMLDLNDIDSPNYVNVDLPYKGTIYLQSEVGKNNIMTSLSNILKQMISFISQKFKSIF